MATKTENHDKAYAKIEALVMEKVFSLVFDYRWSKS